MFLSYIIRPNIFLFTLFITISGVNAKVTSEESKQLLSNLTVNGAIKAGNESGTIPEFIADELSDKKYLEWRKAIQKEQPLFVINADNMQEHLHMLSKGLIALLELYPDTFNIPVYKTHRTARFPKWVNDNTFKNATDASTDSSGNNMVSAWPGLPFPIPKNAKEIIWNYKLRWSGRSFEYIFTDILVDPDGIRKISKTTMRSLIVYYGKHRRDKRLNDWRYAYFTTKTFFPKKLSGMTFMHVDTLKPEPHPVQTFVYMPSTRRARNMSALYRPDISAPVSDGIMLVDEMNAYNGALHYYDWSIAGKKEMIVPYNNDQIFDVIKDESVFTKHHLATEKTRFEIHRVWVVDATLKKDKAHTYQKRRFYIDEDAWSIVMNDAYDKNNNHIRAMLRYGVHLTKAESFTLAIDVYHDLEKKRYYSQHFDHEKLKLDLNLKPKDFNPKRLDKIFIHRD